MVFSNFEVGFKEEAVDDDGFWWRRNVMVKEK